MGDPGAHLDPAGHDPGERGFGDPDGGAKGRDRVLGKEGGQGLSTWQGAGLQKLDAEARVSPQDSCLLEAVLAAV